MVQLVDIPHFSPMRFDWYSASVPEVPERLLGHLQDTLLGTWVEDRGQTLGYDKRVALVCGDFTFARCVYGGNSGAAPSVWASGEQTMEFVSAVRSAYPVHRVTRVDSAIDYDGPGTWDRIYDLAVRRAMAGGLKTAIHGDWHRFEDGRTLYVGSRKSAVFVRFYEKGKQLGADITGLDGGGVISSDVRTDWCRLEVQVRPTGDARRLAAVMTPEQVWGCAGWTAKLLQEVDGLLVQRVNMQQHRIPDCERAFLHAADQYGDKFNELRMKRNWSWDDLGRKLGDIYERKERQRAAREAVVRAA